MCDGGRWYRVRYSGSVARKSILLFGISQQKFSLRANSLRHCQVEHWKRCSTARTMLSIPGPSQPPMDIIIGKEDSRADKIMSAVPRDAEGPPPRQLVVHVPPGEKRRTVHVRRRGGRQICFKTSRSRSLSVYHVQLLQRKRERSASMSFYGARNEKLMVNWVSSLQIRVPIRHRRNVVTQARETFSHPYDCREHLKRQTMERVPAGTINTTETRPHRAQERSREG